MTPEPACRPHVNAGNDYWFEPSDLGEVDPYDPRHAKPQEESR